MNVNNIIVKDVWSAFEIMKDREKPSINKNKNGKVFLILDNIWGLSNEDRMLAYHLQDISRYESLLCIEIKNP